MVQNLATTGRQLTEGFNTSIKALGDNLTQGLNQLLQVPATGLRGLRLPGLPGQAGAGALNLADPLGLFGTRGNAGGGNPNGLLGNGANPLAAVTNVVKAFGQVEDVILPRGLPRPSALILGATTPTEPVVENGPIIPTTGAGTSIGIEGGQRPAAERRLGRQAGVQAV